MSDALSAQLMREMEGNLSGSESEDEVNGRLPTGINVKFEDIRGLRENSKLVWAFEEKNLYYRNAISAKTQIEACKCYKAGCKSRLYIRPNGTAFRHVDVNHSRIHGSMYLEYKMMHCFNIMKDKARSAPASTTNFEIYQEVIKE